MKKKLKRKEIKMKKRPKTYVAIVLDKSSSMASTKAQAIENFNEQVDQMKLNAKDQDIFCSLITFNESVYEYPDIWCVPAEKLKHLTSSDYQPGGCTAMRDGIGYTIRKLQETVEVDDDTSFLLVVISDGMENASTKFSIPALRELVDSVQKTGKWTITYMGCSADYLKEIAQQTNIPISNMAVWSNADVATFKRCSGQQLNKLQSYYTARSAGIVQADCIYSAQIGSSADFTEPDSGVQVNDLKMDVVNQGTTSDTESGNYNAQPVNWK